LVFHLLDITIFLLFMVSCWTYSAEVTATIYSDICKFLVGNFDQQ
jgi:hypothetical protein